MKNNSVNINYNLTQNILSSLNESHIENFKRLLHRIFQDEGMISAIKSESPDATEEKIQITLLQEVSYNVYSQLNTANIESPFFDENSLYSFIILLLSFNNMGKANEGKYLGWKSRASQLRIITNRIIEQISYIFGNDVFNAIKMNAFNFLQNTNKWLEEENIHKLSNDLNVSPSSIDDFIKKLKLSVSALSITLQESSYNNFIQKPVESNIKQSNHISKSIFQSKDFININNDNLLSELLSLAQSNCSFGKLYKEIENKRSTIEIHCQLLKNKISESNPSQKSEIEQSVLKFNYGLIDCYHTLLAKKSMSIFSNSKKIKNTIHKALHCYIKVMIFYYKSYRLIPHKVLKDVHELYQTALNHNISQKRLEKVPQWHNQFKTIEDMYKYCLILKIFYLYQFRFEEITLLFYAFENWAPLLTLNETYQEGDTFIFDFDKGDVFLLDATINKLNKNAFYINISQLLNRLSLLSLIQEGKKIFKNQPSDSELVLSKSILKKLAKCLTIQSKKNLAFKDFQQTISVKLGIDSLKSLNNIVNPVLLNDTLTDIKDDAIAHITIDLLPNEEYLNFNKEIISERFICHILGIHSNLLKTHWEKLPPKQLQPGNFVSIFLDNSTKQIQLGCIHSLWIDENNQNFVIIKTIPKEATLVTAKVNKGNKRLSYKVILIPEQPRQKIPLSIIAPFSLFQSGQEIDLIGHNIEGTVLIGDAFETYHAHQQFDVSFV